MTVEELIKLLREQDADALVVLAKDGEGNAFSPLDAVPTTGVYRPEQPWRGALVDSDDKPQRGDAACIVLWPRC